MEDHHRPGTVLTNHIDVFCRKLDPEEYNNIILVSVFSKLAFNVHHMRSVKALDSYSLQVRRIRVKIEEISSRDEGRFIRQRSEDLHVKGNYRGSCIFVWSRCTCVYHQYFSFRVAILFPTGIHAGTTVPR